MSLASGLPIIADADTGFGESESCHRTVYEYFLAGASGLIKRSSYWGLGVS